MKISKKLSVLAAAAVLAVSQSHGVDTSAVLAETMGTIKNSNSDLIYYLSGIYIAIQGAVDAISKYTTEKNGSEEQKTPAV